MNGTVKTNQKTRPTLLEMTTSHEKMTSPASAPDPYNMMRKSRLGVGESTETSILNPKNKQKRTRSGSSSPMRGRIREPTSPSFETFKPKQPEEVTISSWKNTEEHWSNDEEDPTRRKSILVCDVNVYDLNRKTRKSIDDDSSDELSDSTLQVNSKLKILRPKLTKTDLRNRKINIPEPDKLKKLPEKSEVRLNGQRFKIFDHLNPSNPSAVVEGYVSDDDEKKIEKPKESMIPRLISPKRPPRKSKDKTAEEMSFKYSKLRSKSSPNLSIKSILKKPSGAEEPEATEDAAAGATEQEQESCLPATELPKPKQASNKSNQNTLKKKKQVQFKVSTSSESLNEPVKTEEPEEVTKPEEEKPSGETAKTSEVPVIEEKSEDTTGNVETSAKSEETECDDRKQLAKGGACVLHTQGRYNKG